MDIEKEEETSHYLHSTLRERIVEHVFVGDALRWLWQRNVTMSRCCAPSSTPADMTW